MKYEFLQKQLSKSNTFISNIKQDKENRKLKFLIISFIIMWIYYIFPIILIPITLPPMLYYWLVIGAITIELALGIYVIIKRPKNKTQTIMKWIGFLIFYSIQVYNVLGVLFTTSDLYRLIRNIYLVNVFSGLFLVFFMDFHYVIVAVISIIDFLVVLFCQLYMTYALKNKQIILLEICISLFMPSVFFVIIKDIKKCLIIFIRLYK